MFNTMGTANNFFMRPALIAAALGEGPRRSKSSGKAILSLLTSCSWTNLRFGEDCLLIPLHVELRGGKLTRLLPTTYVEVRIENRLSSTSTALVMYRACCGNESPKHKNCDQNEDSSNDTCRCCLQHRIWVHLRSSEKLISKDKLECGRCHRT